jgi:hypothetical protein
MFNLFRRLFTSAASSGAFEISHAIEGDDDTLGIAATLRGKSRLGDATSCAVELIEVCATCSRPV